MPTADILKSHLPLLRRYARALTGTQVSGDAFVRATLEAIVADRSLIEGTENIRVSLYKVFRNIWESAKVEVQQQEAPLDKIQQSLQQSLQKIPSLERELLLLTALEGFTVKEVAQIADIGERSINAMLEDAITAIDAEARSNILIIEDEALISMELEDIVQGLGHIVCGTATTRDDAIEEANNQKPDLILSDVQLADGSSGIDAVSDILKKIDVPVIFITAFPERLLTGDGPEPTFLITKPFQPNAIRAAISQALYFDHADRETS